MTGFFIAVTGVVESSISVFRMIFCIIWRLAGDALGGDSGGVFGNAGVALVETIGKFGRSWR